MTSQRLFWKHDNAFTDIKPFTCNLRSSNRKIFHLSQRPELRQKFLSLRKLTEWRTVTTGVLLSDSLHGRIGQKEIWFWSMLNMNCRGCRQRFLPLPDLSRKIEGDSVRRVALTLSFFILTFPASQCLMNVWWPILIYGNAGELYVSVTSNLQIKQTENLCKNWIFSILQS